MPIEFPCPKCSAVLRTPDEAAGKKARCPQCGGIADVPLHSVEAMSPSETEAPPAEPAPGEPAAGPESPFAPAPSADFGSPFSARQEPDKFAEDTYAAGDKARGAAGDPANPYASPDAFSAMAEPRVGATERGMQHRRIDFSDVFGTSWSIFTENLGPCVLVGLIKLGFDFALGLFGQVGNFAAQASGEPVAMIGFQAFHMILNLLVQTWTNLGILYFGLRLARTRQPNVADFFAVGPYFLRALLVGVIIFLLCVCVVAVCMAPLGGLMISLGIDGGPQAMEENLPLLITAGAAGAVLAAILVTWIGLRLFLTNVFIVDQDSDVFGSMRSSDTYMRGNKLMAFLIMLVLGLVSFPLVVCTCGIGSIFLNPFAGVLTAVLYLLATGQAFPYRQQPRTGIQMM